MAKTAKVTERSAGQTTTIGLRVPTELKAALDEGAKAMDRNLSQECERRLRRSFDPNELLDDAIAATKENLSRAAAAAIKEERAKGARISAKGNVGFDFVVRVLSMICSQEHAELG